VANASNEAPMVTGVTFPSMRPRTWSAMARISRGPRCRRAALPASAAIDQLLSIPSRAHQAQPLRLQPMIETLQWVSRPSKRSSPDQRLATIGDHARVSSMGTEPRITLQTLAVLKVLLDEPLKERYGLEISRQAGLPTGSIYPILARLEQAGWITSEWEDIDEAVQGRRRRRYYRLTTAGAQRGRAASHDVQRLIPTPWSPSSGLLDGEGST